MRWTVTHPPGPRYAGAQFMTINKWDKIPVERTWPHKRHISKITVEIPIVQVPLDLCRNSLTFISSWVEGGVPSWVVCFYCLYKSIWQKWRPLLTVWLIRGNKVRCVGLIVVGTTWLLSNIEDLTSVIKLPSRWASKTPRGSLNMALIFILESPSSLWEAGCGLLGK